MSVMTVLALLGGLGLFLFGMKIMGEGLEKRVDDLAAEVAAQTAGIK